MRISRPRSRDNAVKVAAVVSSICTTEEDVEEEEEEAEMEEEEVDVAAVERTLNVAAEIFGDSLLHEGLSRCPVNLWRAC